MSTKGRKYMKTKHLGTKLTLASSSLLALAGLTAFLGAKGVVGDSQPQTATAPPASVASRIIIVPSQDGGFAAIVPPSSAQAAPSDQTQPGSSASANAASQPVARSRGT
jgi:hypothetical protein